LPALDKFIREEIPSGFKVNAKEIYLNGAFGIDFKESVEAVCKSIDLDSHRVLLSLGSLGSGNHFLECGHDSEKNIWVTIHSGSRNFGKCVAEFYQDKAKAGLKKYFLDGIYPELEFLPIDSKDAKDYMKAMKAAQVFASYNRYEMARRLMLFFGETEPIEFIESVHNFIDFDGRVIRKGATPANLGQKVLIPFNMKDGVAICVGKGSEKYNCSAPHGAGRILSRKKAKELLNVEAFKLEMADAAVFTTSAGADTLDEAPGAYKDKDLILDNIKETVDVIDFIKPFYNFKAGGD
jgi:RNA-splicing ligase RtcB